MLGSRFFVPVFSLTFSVSSSLLNVLDFDPGGSEKLLTEKLGTENPLAILGDLLKEDFIGDLGLDAKGRVRERALFFFEVTKTEHHLHCFLDFLLLSVVIQSRLFGSIESCFRHNLEYSVVNDLKVLVLSTDVRVFLNTSFLQQVVEVLGLADGLCLVLAVEQANDHQLIVVKVFAVLVKAVLLEP